MVIVAAGIAIGILLRRRQPTPAPIPEKTEDDRSSLFHSDR